MTPAPRQSLPVNVALSLGVLLLLAATLEGGARLVQRRAPARPRVAEYIWDWERMWEGDFYTVGSVAVGWPPWEEFNADGLRDRAHSEEKPPRALRLAFLGDSVTFGDGLTADEAYPQVLQQRLVAQGRRVEVFNVALWGWSTRQARLAYERLVRRYRPERVVLAVCLNDVPELQNNLARPPAWLTDLYQVSAVVRLLLDASGREIESVEELFRKPDAARVRHGFLRFFEELRALRAAVRADGAELAVIVFPFRFQLEPGAPEPLVQRRIVEFCAREGLVCVDLLPELLTRGPQAFRDYDHLSAAGARFVAERLLARDEIVPRAGFANADVVRALLEGAAAGTHVARLAQRLADEGDAERREAAAWALGRRGELSRPALPDLSRALRADGDAGVRAAAARALGEIPGAVRAEANALLDALGDASQVVRFAAAQALGAQPLRVEDDAVTRLMPMVASDDGYVRGFAVWSLGELGPAAEPAVPALMQALREEDQRRGVAAQALAKLGPAALGAAPALVDVLACADARRRWNAAIALGRLGPGAAAHAPALVTALRDGDARVRAQAALALGRLRSRDAATVVALGQALGDESEEARAHAARALGFLGSAARPAVARLNGALRDDDARVRREARKALRRIQQPTQTNAEEAP